MQTHLEFFPPRWRALWLASLVTGLSACASISPPAAGESPNPGAGVASAWLNEAPVVEAPPVADLAQWWLVFSDQTLSGLVERALAQHTSVRSAQVALEQARAQRDVTAASVLPSLRSSGSVQRSEAGTASPSSVFRVGLDASWELDVFGARRSAVAASEAEWLSSAAQLGQTRVSLAAEVALTYIDWRAQQQRLQVAQNNLALQEESLQLTEWRVQAGLASSLDREQALAGVEQTRSTVPPLEAAVRQGQMALAVLTGLMPQAEPGMVAGPDVPVAAQALAIGIPIDTLLQRPDIQIAQSRVVAAMARVAQADANRYPSFSLGGSLDWRSPRLGDLFDVTGLTRALVASFSASLFDGGVARAQVRVQQAALEQARIGLEIAVTTALQEVENALLAMKSSHDRLQHLGLAATAADNAEALARHRYASGLIDYRVLLDAQRTRLSAQSDLATARATWSADHVRLYKALGGGWSRALLDNDLQATAHDIR